VVLSDVQNRTLILTKQQRLQNYKGATTYVHCVNEKYVIRCRILFKSLYHGPLSRTAGGTEQAVSEFSPF
jgi:hypothetical protein